MDFAALPPEINSGLIYTGAGTGPLIGAAQAWSTLSQELFDAAAEYGSVITSLATTWRGPSSIAMQTAAQRYLAWLTTSAEHAARTAAAAGAAVEAFSSVFAAVVPPLVIAANRAQLLMLVATNLLGQNTPAIMANEAAYAEMWAQDAAAMNAYAASSSAATAGLPHFTPAPNATNPVENLQPLLQSVAAQASAAALPGWLDNSTTIGQYLQALVSSGFPFDVAQLFANFIALQEVAASNVARNDALAPVPPVVVPAAPAAGPVVVPPMEAPPLAAASGAANSIGRLSVPPSWAQLPKSADVSPGQRPAGTPIDLKNRPLGAIPAVPFMPTMRSDQQRAQKPPPEYGHVSKVLPPRNPSGG
jgi:PPE-repeat protein